MRWIYILFVLVKSGSFSDVPENFTSPDPCTDENHMFLVPGVLTAGGSNRACVSRFYPEGPARMLLTLVTEDKQTVTAVRELSPGDGGCLDISVPLLPNTKAYLAVNLRYPESQCSWERSLTLRIASGRVLVLHTERARYRPGETVRVRAFVMKADLVPAHGVIDEIWLEGPASAWADGRAAQWQRVRTRLGIAQVYHDLDEAAPAGQWTVKARLSDGSQGSAEFWVGNYELPPFQLSVRHAPKVLRTSERLVWTVCVRYPWTEAVEGMLVIRIRGSGVSTSSGGGIRTAVRLRAPRACHRHAAASRRIGLAGADPPDVVVADFSFQEEGTRVWQNTTVVSQVVDTPVSLEFLTKHRAVISLGLPYKLKVKATRWDDKPAANEVIRVCRTPASQAALIEQETRQLTDACNDATTDSSGVARVMFSADDDGSAFYKFQATLKNSTITTDPLFLPVQRRGTYHAALGPLRADSHSSRTFVPLYLNMRIVTNAITVHFVVITRGGIIYRWGATTQCPVANTANQIQTASRNSPCNNANIAMFDANPARFDANPSRFDANANVANASDSLLDRHLLRVMLPIKVTHQMCPDSHLIAYFYYKGELVSASKHFEMEECFGNKVEATWQTRQTSPGSLTTLNLSTTGPAICALTALDSAAKWVQPAPTVKEMLLKGLRRTMDGHRVLTEYDEAEECFLTADSPEQPTTSIGLTLSWLAAAGVRMLGGVMMERRCSPAPALLVADDLTVPRSDFSEAWLWRLVAVGANGTATTTARAPDCITRYEASATCVARNGIAISSPAVLQVFREFFIHADGPRRLRRGDTTIIRYRLFNYLYEPLSVQIQILTDPHLEGPSDYVESACVGARASIARRVELRAKLPGEARVSVRAKSVVDGSCANASTSRSVVSDEVIMQMTVDPEGVPVQDHKSILLCGRGSTESSESEVSWSWPVVQSVPGTETLIAWAVGDIIGPLRADADDLVMLPRGCGEQNMARLATNLLALNQLDPRSAAAFTAKEHVARGFTRQLQYVHQSGGFSAFGSSDASPSTWLTAFAIRYMRRAFKVLSPGLPAPPALDRAEQWLMNQQMENGCFRNEGQVFHRELRGGLNEEGEIASVALTAYVITSLIENSSPLPSRILRNSLSCLRAFPLKTKSPTKIYAHSLLAHAFMRMRKYEEDVKGVNEASMWKREADGLEQDEEMKEMMELLKLARRSQDYVWWETGSLSTSIEATGYAVQALALCPRALAGTCAQDARAAVRWLSTHRSAAGGFISTQDTLVAIEALLTWSSSVQPTPANLTVTARSSGLTKTVIIQPGVKVPNVMKIGDSDKLSVRVEGTGCALVQATRSYNSYSTNELQNKLLSVQVSVHTEGAFDCDGNGTRCFCAAVVEACVMWSGSFPEMALLEVSLPGGYGADASLLYAQLQKHDTLLRRIELSATSGRATLYLGTRDGSDTLDRSGHHCYNVHAVGPKVRTKPAYVKVMDYYRPMVNNTQMYTIPEECLPRISHESNQYLKSDNLFNKAKSLTGSGEIVITNEFSFEDIPEGIPLEDPMYDNLTSDKEKTNEVSNYEAKNENKIVENVNIDDKIDFKDAKTVFLKNFEGLNKDEEVPVIKNDVTREEMEHDTNEILIQRKKLKAAEKTLNRYFKMLVNTRLGKTNQNFIDQNTANYVTTDNGIKETVYENRIEIKNELKQHRDKEEIKEDLREAADKLENPNLSNFHVIDSEKDLEVPDGIEGPVPAVVLPPPQFRGFVNDPLTGSQSPDFSWSPPLKNSGIYEIFQPRAHKTYYYQPAHDDTYSNRFKSYYSSYG